MLSMLLLFVGGIAVICLTLYPLLIARDISAKAKRYILALGVVVVSSQIGVWRSDQVEKRELKEGVDLANARLVELNLNLNKTTSLLNLVSDNMPIKKSKSNIGANNLVRGTKKTDWKMLAQKAAEKTDKELFCSELPLNSYFAPNPYTGTDGWFNIPSDDTRRGRLEIYNLSGDKIYSHDFGPTENTKSIKYMWPKINSSGNPVAPGVYFAVIRSENKFNASESCQTVIKILIP